MINSNGLEDEAIQAPNKIVLSNGVQDSKHDLDKFWTEYKDVDGKDSQDFNKEEHDCTECGTDKLMDDELEENAYQLRNKLRSTGHYKVVRGRVFLTFNHMNR